MKNRRSNFFISMVLDLLGFILLTFVLIVVISGSLIYYFLSYKTDFVQAPYEDNLELLKDLKFQEIDIEKQLGKGSHFFIFSEDDSILYQSNDKIDYPLSLSETDRIPYGIQYIDVNRQSYQHENYGTVEMIEYLDEDLNTENMLIVDSKGRVIFSTNGIEDTLSKVEVDLLSGRYESFNVMRSSFQANELTYQFVVFNSLEKEEMVIKNILKMLLYISIAIIVLLLLSTLLYLIRLNRKVNKPLILLSKAFDEFDMNAQQIVYKGPAEFVEICHQFNKMSQRLSEVQAEKQRILAGLTHDIRTPLTVLQTYAQAINDHVVPEGDQEEYLDVIYSKAQDMSVMVKMLSDYSQLFHSEFVLEFESVNIDEMIRQYFIEKHLELEMSGFTLNLDLGVKGSIAMDVVQFKRVLDNLLSNTIKYNEGGTGVYIRTEQDDTITRIYFGDDGKGIDASIKEDVFQAFVTNNLARTQGKGTGLGLSIVKKVVEMHNGSIALTDSDLAVEFIIRLPNEK